jgi:hypothetical protein
LNIAFFLRYSSLFRANVETEQAIAKVEHPVAFVGMCSALVQQLSVRFAGNAVLDSRVL